MGRYATRQPSRWEECRFRPYLPLIRKIERSNRYRRRKYKSQQNAYVRSCDAQLRRCLEVCAYDVFDQCYPDRSREENAERARHKVGELRDFKSQRESAYESFETWLYMLEDVIKEVKYVNDQIRTFRQARIERVDIVQEEQRQQQQQQLKRKDESSNAAVPADVEEDRSHEGESTSKISERLRQTPYRMLQRMRAERT